jgi:hypothetical protein
MGTRGSFSGTRNAGPFHPRSVKGSKARPRIRNPRPGRGNRRTVTIGRYKYSPKRVGLAATQGRKAFNRNTGRLIKRRTSRLRKAGVSSKRIGVQRRYIRSRRRTLFRATR